MAETGIQVIDRAFDILELLADERDGLGVTDIAARTGLNKSTAHRILSALGARGYVERSGRGIYRNGLKLVDLASVHLNRVELKTEARPYLRELTARMNLTTHLAILDGTDAVYIDKVAVESSLRLYSQIGRRIPVHCSALGKSLLSGLSERELAALVSGYRFEVFTPTTPADAGVLLRQVAAVRERGYAVDDAEHEPGVRCIAAPIRDYRGKVVAAVSLTGPAEVVCPARETEIADWVVRTARDISRRMGSRQGPETGA